MLRRALLLAILFPLRTPAAETEPRSFFEEHCYDCHDADERKGGLDLASLSRDFASPESFARWMKVYDRVELGEMPPKKKPRPEPDAKATTLRWLHDSLLAAESARPGIAGSFLISRLYEAMFVYAIRAYAANTAGKEDGWLAAPILADGGAQGQLARAGAVEWPQHC